MSVITDNINIKKRQESLMILMYMKKFLLTVSEELYQMYAWTDGQTCTSPITKTSLLWRVTTSGQLKTLESTIFTAAILYIEENYVSLLKTITIYFSLT